jgi:hypothetical protein
MRVTFGLFVGAFLFFCNEIPHTYLCFADFLCVQSKKCKEKTVKITVNKNKKIKKSVDEAIFLSYNNIYVYKYYFRTRRRE